jgi:Flp pilus assembly pilin Flp
MNQKGQTALEYLLIIVVAMTVIIAVMVWMQASQSNISKQTGEKVNAIQCALQDCNGDPDDPVCDTSPCKPGGSCEPSTHKCKMP